MYNSDADIDSRTIKAGLADGNLDSNLQGQLGSQFNISGGDFLDKDQYYIVAWNYSANNLDTDTPNMPNDRSGNKTPILGVESFNAPNSDAGSFLTGGGGGKSGSIGCIKIPIQFLDNVTIQEKAPTYSNQEVLGRFEPLAVWSGMSTMKVTLSLRYVAMGKNGANMYDEVWVDKITSLIKSLMYPTYVTTNPNGADKTSLQAKYNVPPRLFLRIGELIVDLPCYMESCTRDFAESGKYASMSKPLDTNSGTQDKLRGTPKPSQYQLITEEELDVKLNEGITNKKSEFLPYSQKIDISLTSFYETNYMVDSSTVRNRIWRGVNILGGK